MIPRMRRALLLLPFLVVACSTPAPAPKTTPPATAAAAAPAPPSAATRSPEREPYGLTLEEEAAILRLEDRREYDKARAAAWIHHENPLHRARMALALGRIGAATFDDTNGNGVKDAGETQAGVTELASLAGDPNAMVRATAAFALGLTNDPAAIEPLLKFAADKDGTVAAEAVEALSKLAPATPLVRYEEFTKGREREGVRARAIRFLFRFKSDEASAMAVSALEAPSPAIRQEAAYTLARRPLPAALPQLELLITDPAPQTRAYAVTALGRIGSADSVSHLIAALGDPHPWVRSNAAVAVARLAAKDIRMLDRDSLTNDVARVLATADDDDPGVRASAVDLLGWYATIAAPARKKLLDIAANGSLWMRELAAGAIAKHLGDASLLPNDLTSWAKVRVLEAGGKVADAMRDKWLRDADPLVRANALSTVPDDAVDANLSTIQFAVADPDMLVRAHAVERITKSHIERKLQMLHGTEEHGRIDAQDDVRLAAIEGIGDIDDPSREPYLRGLLDDRDPVVRRVAADAIEKKLQKPRPQYTPLPVEKTQTEYTKIVEWSRQPHTATIHMTRGNIVMRLLAQDAPMTAWNFAQLAAKHYFDNTTFMRVVPNFVIQGGDPRNDQEGGPGYAIRDEINLQKYTRAAVGMALSGPDTGGSQFFITHSPQPHLDGGYTIFGRVEDGMSVVDQTERGDKVETITIDS
jgi:cyclophilin family peptidyl-prolyl cis-trans isomerase/HEAT repeat protein